MSSVNIVATVDTSGSMVGEKANIAQRSTKAFIDSWLEGDAIGIVEFNSNASIVYPPSGDSVEILPPAQVQPCAHDPNKSVTPQQCEARGLVDQLVSNGGTNIGLGIERARELLEPPPTSGNSAIMLFTDGFNGSEGPDPLDILPDYPVHAYTMGSDGDSDLVGEIAAQTGGETGDAPAPMDLMIAYNNVRGTQDSVQTLKNKKGIVHDNGYYLEPIQISSGTKALQRSFVWDNHYEYVDSSSPGPNKINVVLYSPTFQAIKPEIIADGYVIFNYPDPQSGTWNLQALAGSNTNRTSDSFEGVDGAFEFPNNVKTSPTLNLSVHSQAQGNLTSGSAAQNVVRAGVPVDIQVRVREANQWITNLHVVSDITQPQISVGQALERYKEDLKSVVLTEADLVDSRSEDMARLRALRAQQLPQGDILGSRRYPLYCTKQKEGVYVATNTPTTEGCHTVYVEVTGISQATGSPFQRAGHLSFMVRES